MTTAHVPRRCAASLLCIVFSACGGATDTYDDTGSFTLSASPASLILPGGGSVTTTITITRVNYTPAVTLSTTVPTGVTATFNPASLSGSTVSSTLTLTAAANAPGSPLPFVVLGTGTDGTGGNDLSIPLIVVQPQVQVTRAGSGTGTVTSSPSGVNCGSACTALFPLGTNVTLTATPATGSAFGGWFGGGCTGTGLTCTLVVTSAHPTTATFNTNAQSFSFGPGLGAANVQQGGNATATAPITRTNGFAGIITFTTSGAPSGLTVSANPAGPTDNSATINLAATSALAAGNYPVTITAAAAGLPSQTGTLNVQVTPAPGGNPNVALSFAGCDPSEVPTWVAVQNGTGAWTRVTMGANNTFTFAAGVTGGFALVKPDGAGFNTSVFYGSRDDFATLALGRMCTGINASRGTQQLAVNMSGVVAPLATISVGGAYAENPTQQGLSVFTLNQVPAGRRDLIATATTNAASGIRGIARMILRRDVTYTGSIPLLDLNGPEYFIPVSARLATSNLAGDQSLAASSLFTLNGSTGPYLERVGGQNAVLYFGVPDSLLRPGDLHVIQVSAAAANGTGGRVAVVLHRSVVADSVDFGPPLNQPTVTTLGTSPYLRLRAQLASQSAYGGVANADFSQNLNSVSVAITANYSATTPAMWNVDIPDLTAAGYDPAWGLKSGSLVDWEVFAAGGAILPFFGATPADGNRILGAFVSSTSNATSQLRYLTRR